MALGKFHGVIMPATPMGSRMNTIWRLATGAGTTYSHNTLLFYKITFSRLKSHVSVDPPGLLREPLEERRPVPDFPLGLRQWLALLLGQDLGQLVLVLDAQVEPAAQQHRALLGSRIAPCAKRLNERTVTTTTTIINNKNVVKSST